MESDRDLKLNFGRWLVGGLLAIILVLALTVILVNLTSDSEATSTPAAEQVEWSIETSEYTPTPGTVTLKGDKPLGLPTETWQNDVMLARTVGGVGFTWNMDVSPEVPTAVYEIDNAGSCDELSGLLQQWAAEVASAPGEARRAEGAAFAQHAFNTMAAQDCEIDTG